MLMLPFRAAMRFIIDIADTPLPFVLMP